MRTNPLPRPQNLDRYADSFAPGTCTYTAPAPPAVSLQEYIEDFMTQAPRSWDAKSLLGAELDPSRHPDPFGPDEKLDLSEMADLSKSPASSPGGG